MPRDFTAFTVYGDGLLAVLISELSMRPAVSLPQTPPSPPLFRGRAIWDTGASRTCITPDVTEALGLEPISVAEVQGVSGRYEANVYKVDVILPNGVTVLDLNVLQAKEVIRGAHALVGMDIIAAGDFAVTNAGKRTFFSFRFPPDDAHIDYVGRVPFSPVLGIQRRAVWASSADKTPETSISRETRVKTMFGQVRGQTAPLGGMPFPSDCAANSRSVLVLHRPAAISRAPTDCVQALPRPRSTIETHNPSSATACPGTGS